MPITISKALTKKLPDSEQADIEEFLWHKSASKCFLCGEVLNRSSDTIVADHDIPEKEGGKTERVNLNLAHTECNSAKRNSPSVPIKPFLSFRAFVKRNGHKVTYGDCVSHFGVTPKACAFSVKENAATFELPNGTIIETPIYKETNPRGFFTYVYLEVPREALFNDPKCQPRSIKINHLWSIYSDLQRNPLHEAPGCRLEASDQQGMFRFLMFDGQHKTIACWLMGRKSIVAKIYLDLSAPAAIELVNSVQAKIKKLPLSPFELASKLADEWQNKLTEYESEVGSDNASEEGFITWLPVPEKTRGKQAFRSALIKDLLDDDDLEFKKIIRGVASASSELTVTENAFKSKVIEKLMVLDPLSEKADEAQILRSRERNNIVKILNIFTDLVLKPDEGAEKLSPQQSERVKRMLYQSSLSEIAKMLRAIFRQELVTTPPREIMEKEPTPELWKRITADVKRLASHLVWTADFNSSAKMKAVSNAMQKNQDLEKSFSAVGLRLGYVVGADELDASCIED